MFRFLKSLKGIPELNAELASHIEQLELMFEGGNLINQKTVDTVNAIYLCTYTIDSKLENIADPTLDGIKNVIARLSSACAGAIDHYKSGDKDEYYFYLMKKIKPWALAYKGQKHTLDNL